MDVQTLATLFADFRDALREYRDGLPWFAGPVEGVDLPASVLFWGGLPGMVRNGQTPRTIPGGPGQYVPDLRDELPRDSQDMPRQLDEMANAVLEAAGRLDAACCRAGMPRKVAQKDRRRLAEACWAERQDAYRAASELHGWAFRAEGKTIESRLAEASRLTGAVQAGPSLQAASANPGESKPHAQIDGANQAAESTTPDDLMETPAILDRFYVSRSTLKRAVSDGRLNDFRPEGHAKNATYVLSEHEVSTLYPRRPKAN